MQPVQFAPPPAPPRAPGIFGIVGIIRLVIVVIAVLIGGGFAIFAMINSRKLTKPHVMIENATNAEVDVEVDGKSIGKLAPESGKVVELAAGTHEIKAGADSGKLTVPETSGYRGLYAIGGKSHLAVVTVYYATSPTLVQHEDKIEPVDFAAGARLSALPVSMALETMDPDQAFVDSVDVPQGSLETSVVHLCHIHEKNDGFVGCPGFHK